MLTESLEPSLCELIVTSYEGDFDDAGRYSGNGLAIMDNGSSFEGEFRDGLFNGTGKFMWPNGVVYQGDFVTGEIWGKGKFSWPDGSSYEGEVLQGKRYGKGVFRGSTGQLYDGQWVSGKREGKGKMNYNEEGSIVYNGDWLFGHRYGYGVMKYQSGNVYEGEWKDDKKSGRGVMIWTDFEEVYGGDWQNDVPHGFGQHVWGDSNTKSLTQQMCNFYRGQFQNGNRYGHGSFFYGNGSQYCGSWVDNCKHGEGLFVASDGLINVSNWDNNRMLNDDEKKPRVTKDVNIQVRLYINDILSRVPPSVDNNRSVVFDVVKQTKEIERLLLRYQSYLKVLYKRCNEFSRISRTNDTRDSSISDPYTANWNKVEKLIFSSINIYKRMSCMTVDSFKRFLLESGLTSSVFNFYDVDEVIRRMREEHKRVALTKIYINRTSPSTTANAILPPVPENDAELDPPSSSSSEIDTPVFIKGLGDGEESMGISYCIKDLAVDGEEMDGRLPILEREFFELIVRVIADGETAKGKSSFGGSLFDTLFRIFATKLQPLSADLNLIDPFSNAFYSDSVQDFFKNSSTYVSELWMKILARSGGSKVQLRHLLLVFLEMRDKELVADVTAQSILTHIFSSDLSTKTTKPSTTEPEISSLPTPPNDSNPLNSETLSPPFLSSSPSPKSTVDLTCSFKYISRSDFDVYLCRIVLSPLWNNGKKISESVSKSSLENVNEEVNVSTDAAAVAEGKVEELNTEIVVEQQQEEEDPELHMKLDAKLSSRLYMWLRGFIALKRVSASRSRDRSSRSS